MANSAVVKAGFRALLLSMASVALGYEGGSATPSLRIIQYVDLKGKSPLVMINAGLEEGIDEGMIFQAVRPSSDEASRAMRPAFYHAEKPTPTSVWIRTGTIKVAVAHEHRAFAHVVEERTELSEALFRDFAGVMAGDYLEPLAPVSGQRLVAAPIHTLAFDRIFSDPKIDPSTFELSERGKEILSEVAQEFSKLRVGRLLIQGFTDPTGPADTNQIESYQRAFTVRQFLVDEFGFDPERVVAVGLGEAEPQGEIYVPGAAAANRRIVMSALPR